MNALDARQMTVVALGQFDIVALEGASSVKRTQRYQHGMGPRAIVTASPKVSSKAAPKLSMNFTPKGPTVQ